MSTPRLFRFSLQTLLLVTTIAAMGITITLLMREIGPLRAEVKKLREETGKLWIEDETKIHAIRIPSDVDGISKFRILLPQGRKYVYDYKINNIPRTGVPGAYSPQEIQPGEHVVSVHFERSLDSTSGDPLPYGVFDVDWQQVGPPQRGMSAAVTVGEDKTNWLLHKETGNSSLSWQSVGDRTEVLAADQPVVIYRARGSDVRILQRDKDGKPTSWTSVDPPEISDGFMLWIEPVK